jgi:hypothetical protein
MAEASSGNPNMEESLRYWARPTENKLNNDWQQFASPSPDRQQAEFHGI